MPIDDKQVRKYEEKYQNTLFERIKKIASDCGETISHIQKTGKSINLESDLPNLGITLYNKLVELQREFKEAGLSIYVKKYEKDGIIGTSFIGDAIIEDLLSYIPKGGQNIIAYNQTLEKISQRKAEQLQALEKVSPLRRVLGRIKKLFVPGTRRSDILYTRRNR